jgi:hypothetical protein
VLLSLSALADQVGACSTALQPIYQRIQVHVLAGSCLHGDDTTVPVLAKGKTDIARCWTYVRDDRPFGGPAPPAALFVYSRDPADEHPQCHLQNWAGILQADAHGGYGKLYGSDRILKASCWAHARRRFFELTDLAAATRRRVRGNAATAISPLALEAVQRIDALFAIERNIHGLSADQRQAARQERSTPLISKLGA